MKFTIETATRGQANYVLNYLARKTGAMCEGGNAATDSVITLLREDDNTISATSDYFSSPLDVADRLPAKWANWIRNKYFSNELSIAYN